MQLGNKKIILWDYAVLKQLYQMTFFPVNILNKAFDSTHFTGVNFYSGRHILFCTRYIYVNIGAIFVIYKF